MFRTVIGSLARLSTVSPNVRASSNSFRTFSTISNSKTQYQMQQRHSQPLSILIRNYAKKSKGNNPKN